MMITQILKKLKEVENQYGVEILFAVESGSRAWGFASPDSDYDIRFVYKRKTEAYLSLWEVKDSIEFMTDEDLDGSGWDLKKATLLLTKSNASFLGWLFSPIVYLNNGETLKHLQQLANENFNPVAGFHHFHSMNKGFYDALESENMTIKSFFYAARTALCANWVLKNATVPPVYFRDLYVLISREEGKCFDEHIALKATSKEADVTELDKRLVTLIKTIVEENNALKNSNSSRKANYKAFDRFFINEIV